MNPLVATNARTGVITDLLGGLFSINKPVVTFESVPRCVETPDYYYYSFDNEVKRPVDKPVRRHYPKDFATWPSKVDYAKALSADEIKKAVTSLEERVEPTSFAIGEVHKPVGKSIVVDVLQEKHYQLRDILGLTGNEASNKRLNGYERLQKLLTNKHGLVSPKQAHKLLVEIHESYYTVCQDVMGDVLGLIPQDWFDYFVGDLAFRAVESSLRSIPANSQLQWEKVRNLTTQTIGSRMFDLIEKLLFIGLSLSSQRDLDISVRFVAQEILNHEGWLFKDYIHHAIHKMAGSETNSIDLKIEPSTVDMWQHCTDVTVDKNGRRTDINHVAGLSKSQLSLALSKCISHARGAGKDQPLHFISVEDTLSVRKQNGYYLVENLANNAKFFLWSLPSLGSTELTGFFQPSSYIVNQLQGTRSILKPNKVFIYGGRCQEAELRMCNTRIPSSHTDYWFLERHTLKASECIDKDNIRHVSEFLQTFPSAMTELWNLGYGIREFDPDSIRFLPRRKRGQKHRFYCAPMMNNLIVIDPEATQFEIDAQLETSQLAVVSAIDSSLSTITGPKLNNTSAFTEFKKLLSDFIQMPDKSGIYRKIMKSDFMTATGF